MIQFSFVAKDYEKFVDALGRFLKVKPKSHVLTLPAPFGNGYFYAKMMNEAMSFLVMNLKFNNDVIMDRKPIDDTGLLLHFLQINYRGHCELSTDIDTAEYKGNIRQRCIFISSPNYPLRMRYSTGTEFRCIAVYFKAPLVRKFLKKDVLHHIEAYSQLRLKGLDKKSIAPHETKLLREIFSSDIYTQLGRVVLYNRVLLLIENLLQRFLLTELPPSKAERLKEKDMDGLKEVEFMLSEKELERFPSINKLSRVALMSSSKLKKRFKEVYGKKLYEYYNYNRLSKARQWIENGEATVKEAAYRSGYSNLSNFSKAFKKEFGLSPREVKPS